MHLDLHIRCVLYLSVSAVFAVVHRNDTADFLGERKISFSSLSCCRELYYTLIYFKLSWGLSGLCELFLLTEFTHWFFFLFFSVWVFKKLLLTEKRGKGFMQKMKGKPQEKCCWFGSGTAVDDGESVGVYSGTRRPAELLPQVEIPALSSSFPAPECFSWHRLSLVSMPHPLHPPSHPPSHTRHSFWSDSLPVSVPGGYISVGSVFQLWLRECGRLWDFTFRFQECAHVSHGNMKCVFLVCSALIALFHVV